MRKNWPGREMSILLHFAQRNTQAWTCLQCSIWNSGQSFYDPGVIIWAIDSWQLKICPFCFASEWPVQTGCVEGTKVGRFNACVKIGQVAYKPDVSDVRETPAEGLIHQLRAKGADVKWHDDLVKEWNSEKSVELTADFDLAILVNPHGNTNLSALGSTQILNTRGGY